MRLLLKIQDKCLSFDNTYIYTTYLLWVLRMSTCSQYFHQSNFSTTTSIVRMQVRVISTRSLNAQPRQYLNRQDTSIDHAESTQHNDCYNACSANTLALYRGVWNCSHKRRGLICSFTTWFNLWMGVCLYRIDYTIESLLTAMSINCVEYTYCIQMWQIDCLKIHIKYYRYSQYDPV